MNSGGDFLMYPPLGPPGHIPGVHVPGTLTPIAAVVALQQQAADDQVAQTAADRRRKKLRAHLAHHRR